MIRSGRIVFHPHSDKTGYLFIPDDVFVVTIGIHSDLQFNDAFS
jgi:hypothetical protein